MRYITHLSNHILQTKNGELVARFGPQGVLIVGDGTTRTGTANQIDVVLKASTPNDETMRVFPTDLLGNILISEEMVGMGNLASLNTAGANLSSLEQGYNRNYFEAPIEISTTDAVSAVANVYYEVLTGTTQYPDTSGTIYTKGQVFFTDGTNTATTGSGTFALTIPPALNIECQAFRPEQFKIKNLITGKESTTDWAYNSAYSPKDNMDVNDPNYFAYVES